MTQIKLDAEDVAERLKAMDKRVHEDKKVTPEECQKELGLARAEHAKLAAALKDKGDNGPGKHPIEPPMKKKMP